MSTLRNGKRRRAALHAPSHEGVQLMRPTTRPPTVVGSGKGHKRSASGTVVPKKLLTEEIKDASGCSDDGDEPVEFDVAQLQATVKALGKRRSKGPDPYNFPDSNDEEEAIPDVATMVGPKSSRPVRPPVSQHEDDSASERRDVALSLQLDAQNSEAVDASERNSAEGTVQIEDDESVVESSVFETEESDEVDDDDDFMFIGPYESSSPTVQIEWRAPNFPHEVLGGAKWTNNGPDWREVLLPAEVEDVCVTRSCRSVLEALQHLTTAMVEISDYADKQRDGKTRVEAATKALMDDSNEFNKVLVDIDRGLRSLIARTQRVLHGDTTIAERSRAERADGLRKDLRTAIIPTLVHMVDQMATFLKVWSSQSEYSAIQVTRYSLQFLELTHQWANDVLALAINHTSHESDEPVEQPARSRRERKSVAVKDTTTNRDSHNDESETVNDMPDEVQIYLEAVREHIDKASKGIDAVEKQEAKSRALRDEAEKAQHAVALRRQAIQRSWGGSSTRWIPSRQGPVITSQQEGTIEKPIQRPRELSTTQVIEQQGKPSGSDRRVAVPGTPVAMRGRNRKDVIPSTPMQIAAVSDEDEEAQSARKLKSAYMERELQIISKMMLNGAPKTTTEMALKLQRPVEYVEKLIEETRKRGRIPKRVLQPVESDSEEGEDDDFENMEN